MAAPTRVPVPAALSVVAAKRAAFGVDPYYRDAWDDLSAACGTQRRVVELLWPAVPVIFRPDAVLARGIGRGLAALAERGLVAVAWEPLRFDRHSVRETWRNQLNVATRERIDAMDLLLTACDAIYVLLRDLDPDPGVPSTTRVSQSKGPADPSRRRPDDLRSRIGPAQESVVTYVHVPDEPADAVRELGVHFDRPARVRLVAAMASGARAVGLDDAVDALYASAPAHDLALAPALDRLEALAAGAGGDAVAALRELCAAARRRDGARWRELLALADGLGLALDPLDRTAIVCALSATHVDGGVPALPDVDVTHYDVARREDSCGGSPLSLG